jgi:hypothetical protein
VPGKLSVHTTSQKRQRASKGKSTTLIFTQGLHHPLGELTASSSVASEDLVRRSTRIITKREGYKPGSSSCKQTTKRKPKQAIPTEDTTEQVSPFIPVTVLQKVGRELEIPEEELTVEKLMVSQKASQNKKVPDVLILQCVIQSWVLSRVLVSDKVLWYGSVLMVGFSQGFRYHIIYLRRFSVRVFVCGHVMHGTLLSSIWSFQ